MTDQLRQRVEAAKSLAEKATSGPWHWDADSYDDGLKRARVCALGRTITQGYYTDAQGEQDAQLVAASHSHVELISLLWDELQKVQKEIEEMRDEAFNSAIERDLLS